MKKILVIDDDVGYVRLMKLRLEGNLYSVVTAADGSEGLKKAESEKPDLIILDAWMPGMGGYLVMQGLKMVDALKSIPIIVISGKKEMKDSFDSPNVKAFILKPYDSDELLKKIQEVLT